MKAKVISEFYDRKKECYRKVDEEIEVDKKRFDILLYHELVEEVSAAKADAVVKKG